MNVRANFGRESGGVCRRYETRADTRRSAEFPVLGFRVKLFHYYLNSPTINICVGG
jgi:hypothetical protein